MFVTKYIIFWKNFYEGMVLTQQDPCHENVEDCS